MDTKPGPVDISSIPSGRDSNPLKHKMQDKGFSSVETDFRTQCAIVAGMNMEGLSGHELRAKMQRMKPSDLH